MVMEAAVGEWSAVPWSAAASYLPYQPALQREFFCGASELFGSVTHIYNVNRGRQTDRCPGTEGPSWCPQTQGPSYPILTTSTIDFCDVVGLVKLGWRQLCIFM